MSGKTALVGLCAGLLVTGGMSVGMGSAGATRYVQCNWISDRGGDYVPRNAGPGDTTCVHTWDLADIQQENADGPKYVDPNSGYGPTGCKSGYVWRDAYNGDGVCVTPAQRDAAHRENADWNQVLSDEASIQTGTN